MSKLLLRSGLAASALLFSLNPGKATPLVGEGAATEVFRVGPAVTPVAMCGYSCRGGGRYVPGPPEVCVAQGLRYCGSSRDVMPRGRAFGEERREEWRGGGGGGCRTITIQRDDGSYRRIRRCD
jgi:hypothetical protein